MSNNSSPNRTVLEDGLVGLGTRLITRFGCERWEGKASAKAQSHVKAQYVFTRASHDSASYESHIGT